MKPKSGQIADDQVQPLTRGITDEQLRAELRRRQEARPRRLSSIKPCDQCRHFRAWKHLLNDPPEDYNPCVLGHKMSFRMPPEHEFENDGEEWGFHRPGCRNRTKKKRPEVPDQFNHAPDSPFAPKKYEPS